MRAIHPTQELRDRPYPSVENEERQPGSACSQPCVLYLTALRFGVSPCRHLLVPFAAVPTLPQPGRGAGALPKSLFAEFAA